MLVMEKTGADALDDAEWPCEVTFTRGNFVRKESIPSAVCSWCQSVLKAEIQAARESDYNRSIRLPPGDKSCGPCRIFRWTTSWLQSAGDYRPEEDYFTLEIIPDTQLDLLFFSITQYRADPNGPVKTIEVKETPLFRADPSVPCPFSIFPAMPSAAPEWSPHHSLSSFSSAARYLETCIESHSSSCSPAEVALPTRLVSIAAPDGGSPFHPRIRLTLAAELPPATRYTALSHCWGPADLRPLTTTSRTLTPHLDSVPWDSIPLTFQDAIRFTLFLGVSHIWIDSLCIVQDDGDDWARESMRMCDVYSGAFLTIAAGSAGDGRGGLYMREGPDVLSIKIQPPRPASAAAVASSARDGKDDGGDDGKDGGVVEFGAIKSVLGHPRMETGAGEEDNSPWPLFERGWVLQERVMSPRVVYFLKDEVAWECAGGKGVTCECGKMGETWESANRGMKREYAEALAKAEAAALGREWRRLVQAYSCLKLSFGDDKLPALSGLAKQMMERKPAGAEYLAGLWSDELGSDLLWVRWALRSDYLFEEESFDEENNGSGGRDQVSEQRGPSWSWVKMNVRVEFPKPIQRGQNVKKWEYTKVLDASTVLETVDPTGRVSHGTLTIEGQLFDAQVIARTRSQPLQGPGSTLGPVEFGLVIPESGKEIWEVSEDHRAQCEVIFDNALNPLGCGRVPPLKLSTAAIKVLRLVRIRTWSGGYKIPKGFGDLVQVEETEYASVLQQCVQPLSGAPTSYRRVGMVKQDRILRFPEKVFYQILHNDDDDDDGDAFGLWTDSPSGFEAGGSREIVTIV